MNFFDRLPKGAQYAVLSVTKEVFDFIMKNGEEGSDFMNHGLKTNNPELKTDPILKELYSEKSTLNRKILKREHEINTK